MREVIAYIGNLKVVATNLLGSLSPVTGAFLFFERSVSAI